MKAKYIIWAMLIGFICVIASAFLSFEDVLTGLLVAEGFIITAVIACTGIIVNKIDKIVKDKEKSEEDEDEDE